MAAAHHLTYFGALRQVVSPRISAHIAGVALITSTLHLNDALLPLIATGAAHGRLSDVGILVGIVALLEVVFIIVWSRIARKTGQMTALAAGTIIYALFLSLLGLASEPWHLYALTLLAGIGAAAIISFPITYLQDLIADRPVKDGAHMLRVAEDEGQAQRDGLGHEVVERRCVDPHHVERADLELLDGVLLGAQGAVRKHLYAELAAARRRELLAHELDGLDGRVVGGMDVGGAEIACGRQGR